MFVKRSCEDVGNVTRSDTKLASNTNILISILEQRIFFIINLIVEETSEVEFFGQCIVIIHKQRPLV